MLCKGLDGAGRRLRGDAADARLWTPSTMDGGRGQSDLRKGYTELGQVYLGELAHLLVEWLL